MNFEVRNMAHLIHLINNLECKEFNSMFRLDQCLNYLLENVLKKKDIEELMDETWWPTNINAEMRECIRCIFRIYELILIYQKQTIELDKKEVKYTFNEIYRGNNE